jgi:LysM repeat protein
MNDSNPFIPQGSLLEQKNKKRARVKIAVLAIFALNILLISPVLLVQACHRGDQAQNDQDTNTVPADTGMAIAASNLPPVLANTNVAMNSTNVPVASNTMSNTPPVPVATDATEYIILPHDTYSSIAKKFAPLTAKALMAANPDVPATKLMPGKKIKIPPSTAPSAATVGGTDGDNIYVVKPGDNLIKIAGKYSTTVKAIQDLNGLKSTQIKAGEKLKVPVKIASTMPVDTAPAATTASNPITPASTMH